MAEKSVRYTPEFKRQMIDLVRGGRTPAELSREFGPTAWTVWRGVRRRAGDGGKGEGGLTRAEREEFTGRGARTASSRKNGRSLQKPRPGLRPRSPRHRSALRI